MKKRKFKKMSQFNVRVTEKQLQELHDKADDTGMAISTIVRKVLEQSKMISPSVELFS